MPKTITVLGLDPSLTNTGYAVAEVDVEALKITKIIKHGTGVTAPSKNKKVRKSSDKLARARTQHAVMNDPIKDYDIKLAVSEVPSGAQSASAAMAFGIVVGLLAALPISMIEVTPSEVKVAACNSKIADKEDMVRWAVQMTKSLGGTECWKTGAKNDWEIELGGKYVTKTMEHQADAIAVIHAALQTQEFKQIAAVLAQF